jgi:hypothetical protein
LYYIGDLQVQDTGCLTSFSIDGEYTSITSSEATQGLSHGLRVEEVYRRDIHPMVRYYVENGMIATLPTRREREKLT